MSSVYKNRIIRNNFKAYQETDFGMRPNDISKQLGMSKQLENVIYRKAIRRLWQDKEVRARHLKLIELEREFGKI